jgi:hypothetical protein
LSQNSTNLTAVWHGLYHYPQVLEPVYFVATILSFGQNFSGTTHEAVKGRRGAPLQLFASVDGIVEGRSVSFTKVYDGTANWKHAVQYSGELSADGTEIEGTWSIANTWSGTFLMIRGSQASESVVRQVFEKV